MKTWTLENAVRMDAARLAQGDLFRGRSSVACCGALNAMSAPRTKPELIEALLPLTKLSRAALNEMRADQRLYMENVVEYYKRAGDGHWLGWNRDRLVQEICMFESDAREELREIQEEGAGAIPACPDCGLKMIQRSNRVDGGLFYGCIRYPVCRATLPFQVGNQPTAVVQRAQKAKERMAFQEWQTRRAGSSHESLGYKKVMADDGEEMDGHALPRAQRVKETSSSSEWEMPCMVTKKKMMAVSPEESEMLKQIRAQKMMETKEQGDLANKN